MPSKNLICLLLLIEPKRSMALLQKWRRYCEDACRQKSENQIFIYLLNLHLFSFIADEIVHVKAVKKLINMIPSSRLLLGLFTKENAQFFKVFSNVFDHVES